MPPEPSEELPLVDGAGAAEPALSPAQGGPGVALQRRHLLPGRRLLVRFEDDPGYWHERVLLWPSWEHAWWITTGDGDTYEETPEDWAGAYDVTGRAAWPQLDGGMVQFAAPLPNDELLQMIVEKRSQVDREYADTHQNEPAPKKMPGWHNWRGELSNLPKRLRGFADRTAAEDRAAAPGRMPSGPALGTSPADLAAGPNCMWLVVAPPRGEAANFPVGCEVDLSEDAVVLGDHAIFMSGGVSGACQRVAADAAAGFVEALRGDLRPAGVAPVAGIDGEPVEDDVLEGLRVRLGDAGGGQRGAAVASAPAGARPVDVRVLEVEYDDHGERYREWRSAVHESSDCTSYSDWPYDVESTALSMSKHFYKHGGSPLLWLDRWLASRSIEEHERTSHEMRCLMESLFYFGTYDQLNLGASAGVECLMRRAAQIIEAYRQDASRPAWHAVKHFGGGAQAMDPIPQSLRAHNAKKVREEVEAENLRLRTRGLQAPPGAAAGDDIGGALSANPKAKSKAKGGSKGAADG